jgi:FixJ family two-component response regulator
MLLLRLATISSLCALIAAYPNEKSRVRALANGAVGFLSKPFNEQRLIECLNAAIELRSSQARDRVAAHHTAITTAKAASR